MRIDELVPKSGGPIDIGSFTVLVGPNNTGKTQTLNDIHASFTSGNARTTVVDDLSYVGVDSLDDLLAPLNVIEHPESEDQMVVRDFGSDPRSSGNQSFRPEPLERRIDHDDIGGALGQIGQFHVYLLDAASRLEIAESSPSHNAQENAPTTLLQKLYESDESVEEILQAAFEDTFEMEIRLDYSSLQELCFRVGDEFEEVPDDPRKARDIMSDYRKLDDQGHGFRSFVGVVLSLLMSSNRIVLMDEPEAFLHPAQARDLGQWIADHTSQISGQVILATHDSNFLSGILAGDSDVKILRLNRPNSRETYYEEISPEITNQLSQDPLLSSQRVLESVFHRGVVVCEGGSDRSVYQAVASRELDAGNILFIDGLGVESIKKITPVVEGAHTPKAAIADIDVLDDHHEFRYLLESMDENLDFHDIRDTLDKRRDINNKIESEDLTWDDLKSEGPSVLEPDGEEKMREIIEEVEDHGLFIVPVGELESWMELGVNKQRWAAEALEAIGTEDCDEDLIEFVSRIVEYLNKTYSN